jgi:GWxTD domain-containing protein
MTLFEAWQSSPFSTAIGWAVLHSLWQGAVAACALRAALVFLRSPRIRYAAAIVVMLGVLAGFALTLIQMTPVQTHRLAVSLAPSSAPSNLPANTAMSFASTSLLVAVAPWLAPFWIAGVCLCYVRDAAGWISVGRLRGRGVCRAPERWQAEMVRLGARMRISRTTQLLESCMVETPVVLGFLRPVILVPVGLLAGLPANQVEAILLHELAHVRRGDYLVNSLQRLVEGLLFYHPAAWWISRVIRIEREHCCDDMAVAMSGDAHEYAAALAALEHNRWTGREPVLAATGGNLVNRIRRLLYPNGPRAVWSPLLGSTVVLVIAAGVLFAWQAQQPQQNAQPGETSPYRKWLDEDVVYLITEYERIAFRSLATEQEMQKFIERFWLRRDPTPGTAVNEMKEEHYRRIDYANKRFSTAVTPGWRTDRGRAYICYGPPDEIESHPSGSALVKFPFEAWKYRHVQGLGDNRIFTFTDATSTGEYRLAPSPAQ